MRPAEFSLPRLLMMLILVGAALAAFRLAPVAPEWARAVAVLGIFCLGCALGIPVGRPLRTGVGVTAWLLIFGMRIDVLLAPLNR